MSAGELGALLASIAAKPPSAQTDAAVKRLTQLLCRAAPGKENCSGEELRTAALQALKAAQARLGEAGADASVATQHAALGRAALAALEACPGAASAASLVPLHYNFVKRLVAARSYETAWAEATALHARLAGNGSTAGTAAAPPRTAEAANVAVGAVLMLLLCCVDSPALGGAKLLEALQAAQSLEPWLGCAPAAAAATALAAGLSTQSPAWLPCSCWRTAVFNPAWGAPWLQGAAAGRGREAQGRPLQVYVQGVYSHRWPKRWQPATANNGVLSEGHELCGSVESSVVAVVRCAASELLFAPCRPLHSCWSGVSTGRWQLSWPRWRRWRRASRTGTGCCRCG